VASSSIGFLSFFFFLSFGCKIFSQTFCSLDLDVKVFLQIFSIIFKLSCFKIFLINFFLLLFKIFLLKFFPELF